MAAKYNLKIEQGATFRQTLWWKNPDETALDLTGYTGRLQIRANIAATDVLISLTTENGGITITQLTGKIELLITATATAAITWSSAVYDLEMVQGSEVYRLIAGNVSVSKEVTR